MLLQYAVLAPSSHNTQPWRFRLEAGRILLYADRSRALPVNDPSDRELTISCGCALMNLRVAAARVGLAAHLQALPDAGDTDLLAVIDLEPDATDQTDAGLFPSITGRRTWRKAFRARDVPGEILQYLSAAAGAEGDWFKVIDRDTDRRDIAELVAEGDAIQWVNADWRRELAAWMRPRRTGDGLTVPGLLAPVAQLVVRTFNMGKVTGAKDRQLADGSPVLAVLGTNADEVADWLRAGQALQRVLLNAHRHGLQASYLNQPIQVPSLRPGLQQIVDRPGFAQILLRLGFPAGDVPATPRRYLDEVIERRE